MNIKKACAGRKREREREIKNITGYNEKMFGRQTNSWHKYVYILFFPVELLLFFCSIVVVPFLLFFLKW